MTKPVELNKIESNTELIKTDKYKISFLTHDRFDDFFEFNKKIYPKLKNLINLKDRFFHHILNNPLIKDKSNPPILIAYDMEDQIIGQLLGNPYEIYVGAKCQEVFYASGFYVLKEYRKTGVGTSLAKLFFKYFKFWITVGVSPMAKNIDLSFGDLVVEMYKFVWFKDLFSLTNAAGSSLFKDKWLIKPKVLQNVEFPKLLALKNYNFSLVNSLESWEDNSWDNKTLKFKRSLEFINWCFFKNPSKSFLYLLNDSKSQAYFVVRMCVYREMNFLEIVDYRVENKDSKSFTAILNAAKKLVRMLRFNGIITTSTHSFFDKELAKNFFLRNRSPEIVITNIMSDINKQTLKRRNQVFVTKTDEILGLIYDPAYEINE